MSPSDDDDDDDDSDHHGQIAVFYSRTLVILLCIVYVRPLLLKYIYFANIFRWARLEEKERETLFNYFTYNLELCVRMRLIANPFQNVGFLCSGAQEKSRKSERTHNEINSILTLKRQHSLHTHKKEKILRPTRSFFRHTQQQWKKKIRDQFIQLWFKHSKE